MAQRESEGRTVLHSFCFECALSPRAPRASVLLCGPAGFPSHLFYVLIRAVLLFYVLVEWLL